MQGKPDPGPKDTRRDGGGPRAIAELVNRLTRRHMGRRGFAEAAMVAEWAAVVGDVLGNVTQPLKIVFPRGRRDGGTLHVRVAAGAMAVQLQHLEPLVVQRINAYFGYAAVERLVISQGPLSVRPKRSTPRPVIDPAVEQKLGRSLSRIDDPELKAVLADLARHLAGRR
jgi:hypothetical protein